MFLSVGGLRGRYPDVSLALAWRYSGVIRALLIEMQFGRENFNQ
jgi:hypothetical protein